MSIPTGILTISDRASRGEYVDLGGPGLKAAAESYGWKVIQQTIIPDDRDQIKRSISGMALGGCHLIITTGGTGISPRDVTPEAVREIAHRELPGFGEAMRMESRKLTANAILSRSLAAVVERSLVICLPGKPQGAVECLGFVASAVPHAVAVIQETPTHC
jgi:molybdopterin adenylyltransferase